VPTGSATGSARVQVGGTSFGYYFPYAGNGFFGPSGNAFTIKVHFTDLASKQDGTVAFQGVVTGGVSYFLGDTMSGPFFSDSVQAQVAGPASATLHLGRNDYRVSLAPLSVLGPIYADVQVTPSASPEPPTAVLLGLSLGALAACCRRVRRGAPAAG
jgi:hypothetical protein